MSVGQAITLYADLGMAVYLFLSLSDVWSKAHQAMLSSRGHNRGAIATSVGVAVSVTLCTIVWPVFVVAFAVTFVRELSRGDR